MFASLRLNWKTSLAGLGLLLITLGNAASQYASGGFAALDLRQLMTGLTASFAAFAAKDANVTGTATPPAP